LGKIPGTWLCWKRNYYKTLPIHLRIIRNKIVCDYEFNVQLVSLLKAAGSDFKNMGQDSYIEKTAIDRVRGLNRFNLFLKLGYLF